MVASGVHVEASDAPLPVPVEIPEGFWQREATHFPKPLSPMTRSLMLPLQNSAIRSVMAEFGLLVEGLDFREIGGWVYNRLVPLGDIDRRPPPAWLMPLLIRLVPQLRRRIRRCVSAQRADLQWRLLGRWRDEWLPDLTARIDRLQAVELPALSDAGLSAHLESCVQLMTDGWHVHFMLHGSTTLILPELAFACRDLLGWEDDNVFALLAGGSTKSTEPARALAALTALVAERPGLLALVNGGQPSGVGEPLAADGGFATAFHDYQRQYGSRAIRYELADPTVAETPEFVLRLIRDQLRAGYTPESHDLAVAGRRNTLLAEARATLQWRASAERERFERALERASVAYPVREENEFYTASVPLGLVRLAVLECGRRLVARNVLEQAEDVFMLEYHEARQAFRDAVDRRFLVTRRERERAWVEAHPGPATYGKDPGSPPALDSFPREVRFVSDAFVWTNDRIFEHQRSHQMSDGSAVLTGVAAAPGRYTGPARVILDEDGFDQIEPGDVLVCPITSPVWSVLFPTIGALVTDTGGTLSHPAIIAREYHIPAVVATGHATSYFQSGETVTVDGDAGTVLRTG